ncbi:MAG: hypothetical protein OEW09_02920 [Anaerolineae bacterium]|nr:hypothetical protein [Anaerolineae bacterium]
MKYWLWILIFVVALSGCGGENVVDTNATYRLRLVESVSKKPIATTLVILVPRVILLQASPGTPDPNREYALELTTDDNGIFYLNERKLRKLFSYFESGSGHVDCTVGGFSRFTIEYNPISKRYLLTAFDENNQVRPLGDQFLTEGKAVELLLDQLSVPSSDNTLKQQNYSEAEDTVIENSQRIAADIEYLLKSQDGYTLHSDINKQEISEEIIAMIQGDRTGKSHSLHYEECSYDKTSGLIKCYDEGTHKELGAYWLRYRTVIDFTCCELYNFTENRTQQVSFDMMIKEGEITIFYPAALIDVNEHKTDETHRDSCPNFPCKPQHYIE